MKSKLRIILPRLIVVLALAVITYAVIDFTGKRVQTGNLNEYLADIDTLLSAGREAEAADLLESRPDGRLSSFQYLLLAKRMWRLGDHERRNELLESLTRTAVEVYPGNQDLAVLRSYVLLAAERPETAYRFATEKLKDDRYLGLIAQAGLASGLPLENSFFERAEGVAYGYASLISLVAEEPEAEAYASAGAGWQIHEFIADAALLYAREGKVDTANELMRRSAYLRFPELELQLAYDARDAAYGLAAIEALTSTDDDYGLYRAEFLYLAGREDAAEERYRAILTNDPNASILAYLNLAYLDPDDALAVLDDGIAAFPDSLRLLERLGERLYQQGETTRAAEIFNRVLAIDPERAAARIRLSESRRGSGSMGDISRLWDAYHDAEEKGPFASQLAWRLYGERNREGLELLVAYQAAQLDGRSALAGALLYILESEYAQAAAQFDALYRLDNNWRYAHNQGLLLRYAGLYEESVDAFQAAEGQLTRGGGEEKYQSERSLVWLGLAETQLAMGERKNAALSLDFALDLDPDNLRAGLLQANMNR